MKYTTHSYGYNFFTLEKRKNYFIENVVKFTIVNKKIKIINSWCNDQNFYNKFNKSWDIFILWIDKNKIDEEFINNKFKNILPLYPIFGKNYILITKIISKQIYELAKTCTISEIGDIYLREFGAVLTYTRYIQFPKQFHGSSYPVIWEVKKSDVQHITPRMHGWFSKNTKLLLHYTLKNFDYNIIVELGSWLGKSTSFILQNMKNNTKLYCYDKFQNIANTPYNFPKKHPMDNFYFTTPRYETFCKNISPYLSSTKKCFTIKYDVNEFITVLSHNFIIPNIIFIDAIKNKHKLLKILNKIFNNYPEVIVIGDDYVFATVKEAISEFINKNLKINYYITDEAYLLTLKKINNKEISDFITKSYFLPKTNKLYLYELILYKLNSRNVNEIINILENNKIDINKKLYNDNTLYTCIIASIYMNNKKELMPLKEYIDANYKIKKINNVLGLNYTDYIKYNDLYL